MNANLAVPTLKALLIVVLDGGLLAVSMTKRLQSGRVGCKGQTVIPSLLCDEDIGAAASFCCCLLLCFGAICWMASHEVTAKLLVRQITCKYFCMNDRRLS